MRRVAALKMLAYDRSTTIGSLLGVVAIVFLVGQQLSVLFGLFTYMSVLVDHSGADVWILSKNTENVNNTGSVPVRYKDRISGLHEVAWVEPVVFGGGSFKTKDGQYQAVQVVGVRSPRFAAGPWRFYKGSLQVLFDYDGITVDRLDLKVLGYPEVNDIVEIRDKSTRISGITQSIRGFAGTLIYTNMVKAKEIIKFTEGRCSAMLVKLKPGINSQQAIKKLEALLPAAQVTATAELSRNTRSYYIRNTGIGGSFGFSTLVGALVGVVIITLTMYTSVLNREKEFAVLRALGARKKDILIVVLYQALMIGIAGIFIGFLLLAWFLYATHDSRLPSYMPHMIPVYHALFTLLLCIFGSLLAMRKAVSIDPATVFR